MSHLRKLLCFYGFAFIGALAPALCSLVETSELPKLKLNMTSQDFEYILSWEGNFTAPVYYNVKYRSTRVSKPIMVMECSNITRSFCNLTKEFTDPDNTYMIFVEPMSANGTKYPPQDGLFFNPYFDTYLSPPQFNVSACPKCANVTVKVLSPVLKLYGELDYIISVATAGSKVREVTIRKKQESFYHVIEDLNPNINYCISVGIISKNLHQSFSSPKCIIRNTNKNPDFSVFLAPMLVVVVGLMLFGMYRTGFVCLRIKEWPKALKFTQFFYSVFEPEPEEVHSGQITICENQKSKNKEWGYNYDDDSESDFENDGLYTNRKTLGKTSESCSEVTVAERLSTGSFSAMNETAELLGAEATTIQNDLHREDNTASKIIYPSPEVNYADVPEPEHCSCLNVNLNTVVLRTSGVDENIAETLILYKEDTSDLKESCAFEPSDPSEPENIQDALDVENSGVDNLQHSWQNSNWTAESESSDSELDTGNEYLRR